MGHKKDINSRCYRLFQFYSPYHTFGEGQPPNNFLSFFKESFKDSGKLEIEEVSNYDRWSLEYYYDKGKQCYDVIVEYIKEARPGVIVTDDVLQNGYAESATLYPELYVDWRGRSATFVDVVTGDQIDIAAYAKAVGNTLLFGALDGFPPELIIRAFGALQCLDRIIEASITDRVELGISKASEFHDNYFNAVSSDIIKKQTTDISNRDRTQKASQGKAEKAALRNSFIIELWKKSKLDKTTFAHSAAVRNEINEYSKEIGIKDLTETGGYQTIYRLVLAYTNQPK